MDESPLYLVWYPIQFGIDGVFIEVKGNALAGLIEHRATTDPTAVDYRT
jgi:hypothetical protein